MASYLSPTTASLARFSPHLLQKTKPSSPVPRIRKQTRQLPPAKHAPPSNQSELEICLLQEIAELELDLQTLTKASKSIPDPRNLELSAVVDELLKSNEEFLNNSREIAVQAPQLSVPNALPDLSSIIEANLDALTHCQFVNSSIRVESGVEPGTTSTRYDIYGFCHSRHLQFQITMSVVKERVVALDIHASDALSRELGGLFNRLTRERNIGNLLYGLSSYSRLCATRSLVFHNIFNKYNAEFIISSRESRKPSKVSKRSDELSTWIGETQLHVFRVTELVITWEICVDATTGNARNVLTAGLRVPSGCKAARTNSTAP
ncbi:hypothetical protein NEOLI_000674 [Neolecta irregularis DAH-3]|uniref:Uncharacterized protein n=1 Tax=Neolecta irregularis (strain DAH-3) TaxID=1198029 RepID=A0A1U7LVQ5_NEOID|nr:hypothetical protein NEOLI_000674 [Neolecta irregularis DAH-3]|eukprot:OLL26747.1 hypothetical protein NEOLI_000674 [Neolecta irregularis DAH-3]